MYSLKNERYLSVKRILDIIFSAILIAFLILPMALIGAIICINSSGGAIFRQRRVGKNGKSFVCYKFRTMYKDAPENMPQSKFYDKDRYITPVGRFLRLTSLDELPQLFNVLKGDMSLVGPRPLIPSEGEIHELRRRCGVYSIRPGITGLAQINGRDKIDDLEKTRLDVRYRRNMSLLEDVRIAYRTLFI